MCYMGQYAIYLSSEKLCYTTRGQVTNLKTDFNKIYSFPGINCADCIQHGQCFDLYPAGKYDW